MAKPKGVWNLTPICIHFSANFGPKLLSYNLQLHMSLQKKPARALCEDCRKTRETLPFPLLTRVLTLVMMRGSPCSSPPFRVKPHGAPPLSWTWIWLKDTSCSTVSIPWWFTLTLQSSFTSPRPRSPLPPSLSNCPAWGEGQAALGEFSLPPVLRNAPPPHVTTGYYFTLRIGGTFVRPNIYPIVEQGAGL